MIPRDLPWRYTRDPWAVLVSEVMLQQTQVERVVPRWRSFLERWPTAAACAAEPAAEIVRAWAGLGYNRRALNLHRCARAVVERHAGELPDDLPALLALPGVGPYTARAVLAFAFERDVAVLDVNTRRVLIRAAWGRRVPPRAEQRLADGLVPPGRAWAWNQALLDLGATVCTARRPRCGGCPAAGTCRWRAAGGPDPAAGLRSRPVPFEGSDRQARGRLLDALREGPVRRDDADERIAAGLIRDGFAVEDAGWLVLRPS